MKRYLLGLSEATAFQVEGLPDGLYLVRVLRVQYGQQAHKPYFVFVFSVLEPKPLAVNQRSSLLHTQSNVEAELVPA